MKMEGWQDNLHISLLGEHVLFSGLHLDSSWHFLVASLLTIALCLSERALTFAISKSWSPFSWSRRSRLNKAIWKTAMYWLVTFDRLLYMLVAMTFSVGLIVVTVTALSAGQFIIEYLEATHYDDRRRDTENTKEPLLSSSPTSYDPSFALSSYPSYRHPSSPRSDTYSQHSTPSPTSQASSHNPLQSTPSLVADKTKAPTKRPRSKSKPTQIFIHPNESNLARADAAALQLGIGGDTERVKGNLYPAEDELAWAVGKGKDLARELMERRSTT